MTELIEINEETLQDIINIETGLLYPLKGFMNERDFRGVVDECLLSDGQVFTIPITLDIPENTDLAGVTTLHLSFQGKHGGYGTGRKLPDDRCRHRKGIWDVG